MRAVQDRLLDLSLDLLGPARPWPVRYGVPILFTLAIAGVKLLVPAFGSQGPDLFLTVPVAASAVLAGFGPALLAAVSTTLVAAYFSPPLGPQLALGASGLDILGFFVEGLVVAVLGATARAGFARALASLRRIEEVERERTAFIEAVVHEVRNPLTSLSGHLQLASRYAKRDDMRDRVPASVEGARQQVARLLRLVEDLHVASASGARFQVEARLIELAPAARAAAARAEPLDASRTIICTADASGVVSGDPARLDQILDNLLKNAVSYTPRGTPIEIATDRDGARGVGIIRVRDHGIGVAPADRERIFDRFVRGSASGRAPGTGLGLYISAELARGMGGRLYLEETSERGSVFTVELPLANVSARGDGNGDGARRRTDGPGVEDGGEELDSVDEARAGTAEVRGAVDPDDASVGG